MTVCFLDMAPKAPATKNWTLSKLKTRVSEDTINKVRQPTEWEKIFTNIT